MEETQKSVKMPYLMHAVRVVFASAFIASAWREYSNEGTWRVFSLVGGVAAEEYIVGLGIVMKAKHIIGLSIVMNAFGGILLIFNTYLGVLLLLIYQAIWSPILYDLYDRDFVRFRQSYQHFINAAKSVCDRDGVFKVKREKLYNQINELVNVTLSTIEHYNSMANELFRRPEFCDQIDEIEKVASSNHLFTQSKFNTFFMPFIKGLGIVVVLVFFIAMKHKYGMLKKHKTN